MEESGKHRSQKDFEKIRTYLTFCNERDIFFFFALAAKPPCPPNIDINYPQWRTKGTADLVDRGDRGTGAATRV